MLLVNVMNNKFAMIDEGFICKACGKTVEALGYTARNHCPYCLHSIHLDIYPGDRSCACKGILIPIGIDKNKKGLQIAFKCSICGILRKNIVASDDNTDIIIQLSALPW
jgi:DNA-directed RNA polymerase subunit RPC12/RpoP